MGETMKTIFKTVTLALALFISGNVQAQSAAEQESPGEVLSPADEMQIAFQTRLNAAIYAEARASERLEIIEGRIRVLQSNIASARNGRAINDVRRALQSQMANLNRERINAERDLLEAQTNVRDLRAQEAEQAYIVSIQRFNESMMRFGLPTGLGMGMGMGIVPSPGFGGSPFALGMGSSPSVLFGFDGSRDKYLRSDRSMQSIVEEFESGAGSNSVIGE
jgi:hypothetical protein